jgi:hypothetical protein
MAQQIEVTVVLGHRGGGQILGVFTDGNKVRAMKEMAEAFNEKGYVSFGKVKVDEFQLKKFGLYFR